MIEILEELREEFMDATFGEHYDDEVGELGVDYFYWEWKEFKADFQGAVKYYISVMGSITSEVMMSFIIIDWCEGCVCYKENIDKEKLKALCDKIISNMIK